MTFAITAQQLAAAQSRWPEVTAETLEHGRQVFLQECGSCHGYPDRGVIADERWPAIVERMAQKADIEAADSGAVLRFILAERVNGGK